MILGNRDKPTSIGEAKAAAFNKKFDFNEDDNLLEKGLKGVGRYTLGAGFDAGAMLGDIVRGNIMGDRRYQREWGMDDFGDALSLVPGTGGLLKAGSGLAKGAKHIAPTLTKAGRQGMKPGAVKRSTGKAASGLGKAIKPRKRDIALATAAIPTAGAIANFDMDAPIASVMGEDPNTDGGGGRPDLDNPSNTPASTGTETQGSTASSANSEKPIFEDYSKLSAYAQQLPEGREKHAAMRQLEKLVRGRGTTADARSQDFEKDLADSWSQSATGRRDGRKWNELDPETKQKMRNNFIDNRLRGAYNPEEGARGDTGARGAAGPAGATEPYLSTAQAQALGTGVNNQVNALRSALAADPNNQDLKNALNSFEQFSFPKSESGPTPLPKFPSTPGEVPADMEMATSRKVPLNYMHPSTPGGVPADMEVATGETVPFKDTPTFEPQQITPSVDIDLDDIQRTTTDLSRQHLAKQKQARDLLRRLPPPSELPSINEPAPAPQASTPAPQVNTPAPAPQPEAPAPQPEAPSIESQTYNPVYGKDGFQGHMLDGRMIQAPQGFDANRHLQSLQRLDSQKKLEQHRYGKDNPFASLGSTYDRSVDGEMPPHAYVKRFNPFNNIKNKRRDAVGF